MRSVALEPMNGEAEIGVPLLKRIAIVIPLLLVLGITLPIIVYVSLMQSTGWGSPLLGANSLLSSVKGSSNNVVLYGSPGSKSYFNSIGGNYETLLVPWRAYFSSRKFDFEEIQDIKALANMKDGVLVLASAVSLDAQERAEISAFRGRGGSILTTWATGTRSGRGQWEGWQFLESLGVKMLGEMPPTTEVNYVVLTGESPVSNTLPSGHRVWISKTAEAFLRFEGPEIAGRFMNWARVIDDSRRNEGAVVFSEATVGSSRAVSFAFSESAWESHPLDAYELIDDCIHWLRHEPRAIRASWPRAQRSAQVMEMDTEEGFSNALTFASMMQSIDYRATFYVLTSVAKTFPEILARLARNFELGYHADVHTGFKGQTAAVQEKRIVAMRADLDKLLVDTQKMTGFRAPTESYDATTEQLLVKHGIRHHTADPNRSNSRLPLIAKLDDTPAGELLVVLPRTQRDDINMQGEKLTPEQTTKALIDDFDLATELGSLSILSVHSQNFGPNSTLTKAMPAFLEHLKQRRSVVWRAPAGQVADWWRDRENFRLSSKYTGRRLDINISILGQKSLADLAFVVMLPQKGVEAKLLSVKVGQPAGTVSRVDDFRSAVNFGSLAPGNYAYQVSFSKE